MTIPRREIAARPTTDEEADAAARMIHRRATGPDDETRLLNALGLNPDHTDQEDQ